MSMTPVKLNDLRLDVFQYNIIVFVTLLPVTGLNFTRRHFVEPEGSEYGNSEFVKQSAPSIIE